MTAAQRAELKAQLEAEERAEKQKREDDIAAYKDSVDEFCRGKFARLQALSEEMRRAKEEVFSDAERLIALKEELFRTKSDRHSNQFTTSDGGITVALGYRTNDGWDDTVNAGVDKVKTFIRSLAKDDDSAALTEMVMNLLAKDRKGNLKASRVLQLREIARKSGYPELIEATDIIQSAYLGVLQGREGRETCAAALAGGDGIALSLCKANPALFGAGFLLPDLLQCQIAVEDVDRKHVAVDASRERIRAGLNRDVRRFVGIQIFLSDWIGVFVFPFGCAFAVEREIERIGAPFRGLAPYSTNQFIRGRSFLFVRTG